MASITQVITTLPTAPDPATMTRDEFSTAAAASVLAQKAMVPEINTWATQANALTTALNAIAAGTAIGIPYTFSTTTTDSDPGAGMLRLDNATQNAATTIRADLSGNDASVWTDALDTLDDSTSTVKGHIRLVKNGDATKWLLFTVSALASPSGYKNITVANVASSAASPFANGDNLVFEFTRTGDKGDTGATGAGVTPQAVGFTVTAGTTPKTLTVPFDADVSGTNTGDNATNTQYSGLAASKANAGANSDITSMSAVTTLSTAAGVAVHGSNTNTAAAAGYVGEVIESIVAETNSPATTVYGDLTSVTVTAGCWVLNAQAYATLNGATITGTVLSGIGTVTGDDGTGLVVGDTTINLIPPTATSNSSGSIAGKIFRVTGSTTYYLKMRSVYSAGTPQFAGRLTAMRIY